MDCNANCTRNILYCPLLLFFPINFNYRMKDYRFVISNTMFSKRGSYIVFAFCRMCKSLRIVCRCTRTRSSWHNLSSSWSTGLLMCQKTIALHKWLPKRLMVTTTPSSDHYTFLWLPKRLMATGTPSSSWSSSRSWWSHRRNGPISSCPWLWCSAAATFTFSASCTTRNGSSST